MCLCDISHYFVLCQTAAGEPPKPIAFVSAEETEKRDETQSDDTIEQLSHDMESETHMETTASDEQSDKPATHDDTHQHSGKTVLQYN